MKKREKVIELLVREQQADGGFGRFHTMNTRIKQKIPTTEAAAWLMYENNITRNDEVCSKTCLYMERLLRDISQWPDSWEKNAQFNSAVPLFIASKLALFTSETDEYKEICNSWLLILDKAFQAGQYSADAVNDFTKNLIGTEIDNSYIGLHSLNCLALFAFNADIIPVATQKSYLKWLHNYDGKIAYTNIEPKNITNDSKSSRVISLLSRFEGFENEFSDPVE